MINREGRCHLDLEEGREGPGYGGMVRVRFTKSCWWLIEGLGEVEERWRVT